MSAPSPFRNILPPSRLGQQHETLGSFRKAADFSPESSKEYTLIVVTDTAAKRILLGHKHRGFGTGMFNSFGGKVEQGESIEASARRELVEETGIDLPLDYIRKARVGTLFFTFQDNPTEMIVHLFRVHISIMETQDNNKENKSPYCYPVVNPNSIRGCDEITPHWFHDWHSIPLDNMFADDSVWLTFMLTSDKDLFLDGWFHFLAGGTDTNTILHHYLDTCPQNEMTHKQRLRDAKHQPLSLERRLFHALHVSKINSPTLKEFNESYAFVNTVRDKEWDMVLDVAGGHGALAALFLITTKAKEAVVIDPAHVGAVQRAWGDYIQPDKTVRYRHECLRTGLPIELEYALTRYPRERILVVACHACQHLSEEIVELSCERGVNVAVMPCCQKDASPGSNWKIASKNLKIPVQYTMDILLAGKVMSWGVGKDSGVHYDVRMKVVNPKVTPQNRLIFCRALPVNESPAFLHRESLVARAHSRLDLAYKRAHRQVASSTAFGLGSDFGTIVSAFALGVFVTAVVMKR